jgi:hypothetical protein
MEDQYAAQLNMARAQKERQRAQEEEVKRVLPGGTARIVKNDVTVSVISIILIAFGIELIPFFDILPSFIGAVVAVYIRLKLAGKNPNPIEFVFMGMFAAINDFADWLIIGSIPIIGDVFDGIITMLLSFWAWLKAHSS